MWSAEKGRFTIQILPPNGAITVAAGKPNSISTALEKKLVHIPVGIRRSAGAAGSPRADDEGALHPRAVLADRIDLAVVHAGHGVGLAPDLAPGLAPGQRQPARTRDGLGGQRTPGSAAIVGTPSSVT